MNPGSEAGRPVVGWILVAGLAVVLAAVVGYMWLGSSSTDDRADTAADAAGQDPVAPDASTSTRSSTASLMARWS